METGLQDIARLQCVAEDMLAAAGEDMASLVSAGEDRVHVMVFESEGTQRILMEVESMVQSVDIAEDKVRLVGSLVETVRLMVEEHKVQLVDKLPAVALAFVKLDTATVMELILLTVVLLPHRLKQKHI